MKAILTLLTLFLVLFLIGAVFYGGYIAIDYVWGLYEQLDSVIRIVLVSSIVTLLVSTAIIAGAIKSAATINSKQTLMDARLHLYKALVSIYRQYLQDMDQASSHAWSVYAAQFQNIEPESLILASGAVLQIHEKFQRAIQSNEEYATLRRIFQQLIKSMRRDFGHGPAYDESRLIFLVNPEDSGQAGHSSPGVSL